MIKTRIKLTKDVVAGLQPGPDGSRRDYYDSQLDNFGVRVSATSRKYFVMKLVGRKRVRVTIGSAQVISPDTARSKAKIEIGRLESGINPNDEKKSARIHQKTLQYYLNEYQQIRRIKPRTVDTYNSLFKCYLSDWLTRPITDIDKEMISKRHKEIAAGKFQDLARGKPRNMNAAADNCMRTLRAVINFAMDDLDELLPINPVTRLSRRKEWFGVPRRRRLIDNKDLAEWFKAVQDLKNNTHRDFLLFLLYTGLRLKEACRLAWSDVDLDKKSFLAPDTKTGVPLYLPMSGFIYNLLMERQKLPTGPFVFPGRGVECLVNPNKSITAVTAATGIKFSCHDLRRTFITVAESLDLSPYAIKALVNHKLPSTDVTGGYIIMTVERLLDPMQRIADFFDSMQLPARPAGRKAAASSLPAGQNPR